MASCDPSPAESPATRCVIAADGIRRAARRGLRACRWRRTRPADSSPPVFAREDSAARAARDYARLDQRRSPPYTARRAGWGAMDIAHAPLTRRRTDKRKPGCEALALVTGRSCLRVP